MNPAACPECGATSSGASVLGLRVLHEGRFAVHPKLESAPVAGWLVVAPQRHVEQWDALNPRELAELGPLVARVAAALRAETPTAKVYVTVFAEVLPHFHVHVVARPPELAMEERGARLLLSDTRVSDTERIDLFRRVSSRLRKPATRSPWASVLLSGLVWPGAGQLRNGERLKGLIFGLTTLAFLARFAWGVARDVAAVLLEAPAPMGLLEMWDLAQQIQRRNAVELSLLTVVLMLLWGLSVLDAWWVATRKARTP
jgi:diadenosine tetraphosphate (Ap4A) HIT family hydrolase